MAHRIRARKFSAMGTYTLQGAGTVTVTDWSPFSHSIRSLIPDTYNIRLYGCIGKVYYHIDSSVFPLRSPLPAAY